MAGMGQQNVPIIAHEAAVAPIRRAASTDLPVPTLTFAERLVLDHLGRRIELHYLGRSHTDNMIVPFVPDAGIIFAVDFVSNDRVAYQQMPGWYFPDIFDALKHTEPGRGGEIQLTDAINILAREQAVFAYRFEHGRYDVGNKLDYLKATVEFAIERDDVGPGFRDWLGRLAQREKLV